ncbi:MAG TPA: hypothetical protein V6D25_12395 [Leptolyngbyaceae cyanobacterium]
MFKFIDANTLVQEHLEQCEYQVCGYGDDQDEYYEIITLPLTLEAEDEESKLAFQSKTLPRTVIIENRRSHEFSIEFTTLFIFLTA